VLGAGLGLKLVDSHHDDRRRYEGRFSLTVNGRSQSTTRLQPPLGAERALTRTRWDLGTTRKLSKLTAHSVGIPSSSANLTSVGIPRMVRVMGAPKVS